MKKTYLKKDESESVDVTSLYDEDDLSDEEENALDKEIKLIMNTLNCEKKLFSANEICAFKKVKHRKSWLVQLATGTKRKVSEVVEKCPLVMNGLVTCVNMNVLPLGSYDVLIGLDWFESHKVNFYCYNKTFECMDEEGTQRVVRGIPKVIYIRHASTMQLKKLCRKGFQLYVAHVVEAAENETPSLEDFHVLQEFRDVFLDEIQ